MPRKVAVAVGAAEPPRLTLVPKTLYSIEETISAMIECADTVTPEQEEEYIADLSRMFAQKKDKIDSAGHALAHFEVQAIMAKDELARLRDRKAFFDKAAERLETYILGVMAFEEVESLEGHTVTFTTRKCPASLSLTSADAIPDDYRIATIKIPASRVEDLLDALPADLFPEVEYTVVNASVKAALQAGAEVEGAKLVTDKKSLVRK